ncbi:MAG: aquaporin family protein [Micropruina sp.]|nr:aquaporin family protein [Micropruina sp.]
MNLGTIFLSEVVGTAMLLLLGAGVVANNILPKNKGAGTGFLHVNFGWGIAVFAGVLVSAKSGAHLNPAVTVGVAASGAKEFVPGIPVDFMSISVYIIAQLIGAFIGACLAWMAYKRQFDEEAPAGLKLAVFSTGPEIRDTVWNLVTEALGTFVLVFVILGAGKYAATDAVSVAWLGALGVAILVVGIGASLGGPTGYAINPARDLGPRIAHFVLPIKGKGDSDWSYSWIPVVGPLVGGALAGLLSGILLPM